MESTTTQSSGFKKSEIIVPLIILGIYLIFTLIYNPKIVNGVSMEPTFGSGDIVQCKKLKSSDVLVNGDIYVVELSKTLCIKRLIAGPHDKVFFLDGDVYVNNTLSYPFDKIEDAGMFSSYSKDNPLILNENEYLFLGDNRRESHDSRIYGLATKENIKAFVVKKLY